MAVIVFAVLVGMVLGALVQRRVDRPRRPRTRRRPKASLTTPEMPATAGSPPSDVHPSTSTAMEPGMAPSPPAAVAEALPPIEIPPELVKEGDELEAQYHRKRFRVVSR